MLILTALLLPFFAHAEYIPKKGEFDPRVRIVEYNRQNVTRLTTFFGVSTHIEFGETETIKDVAIGDDQAWKVMPRGNHLFIKPQATNADTNLTVITNKRAYQFALVVLPRPAKDSTAWSDPNLIFSLSFRYPDDEAAELASNVKAETLKTRLDDVKTKLSDASKTSQNIDYWVAGSEEISPTSARDDGRFIFLTFSNNRDMPAVYSVDSAGNESLVNTNVIDSNTIVVQRLVARLMLRKGTLAASVVNKSFSLSAGSDNASGTVAPGVIRVIKGEK